MANSRHLASNFESFSQSLKQFVLTVGQNNFRNKIPYLHFKRSILFSVNLASISNAFFLNKNSIESKILNP